MGEIYSPVQKENENESILYVYTVDFTNQALRTPAIEINGKHKVDIRRNVYVWEKLSPGQHILRVKNDYGTVEDTLPVDITSGEDVYVKVVFGDVNLSFTGVASSPVTGSVRVSLVAMEPGVAIKEISKCRYELTSKPIAN